ncbi:histone H3.v1-like [Oncorhynchus keta]|uniref:histone H3.v1-like n=1 Tax=Oncorhynchus keta TaxID=8018 RepID=UPI00227C1224|nr:histone H3.v1-like [Oncorhynchus keta]
MSRDSHSKASKMKLGGDLFDDSQSDSGVSADFSPGSTVELQTTTPTLTSPPADETPIEREIRRAVQREQSLRRSRGLHNNPPTQEYVDIPLRKSVLTETLPSKSDKSQGGKDRLFAGKKMQKEISVETQREQVLVRLGKVRGSYDKGTVRQLKERKKLFEAFQEPKETSSMILSQSKAPSWASASDLSTLEIQGNDASSVSFVGGSFGERRRSSLELMSQTQNQSPSGTPKGITYTPHGAPVPRGPTLSESAGGQIIILDNHHHLVLPTPAHVHHVSKPLRHSHSTGTLTETQGLTVVDSASIYSSTSAFSGEERRGFWRDEDGGRMDQEEEEEEEEEVPKENPFFKLRSSSVSQDKVEQDIREAREREKELRRQRSSLYREGGGGGGRPASREVQSPTSPPPPLLLQNGLVTPELSVTPSSRTASATPTARQSLGKLGMWPPPQTDEYPDSQSEGLQSPRTPDRRLLSCSAGSRPVL